MAYAVVLSAEIWVVPASASNGECTPTTLASVRTWARYASIASCDGCSAPGLLPAMSSRWNTMVADDPDASGNRVRRIS